MRLSRKRRREGTHFVRVQLDSTDIDGFIRLRLLRRAQRQDTEALQVAVRALIYRVLEGASCTRTACGRSSNTGTGGRLEIS
jgi:hypothetical protein